MKIYNTRRYRLVSGSNILLFCGIDGLSAYLHGENNQAAKDALYFNLELHGRVNYYHMTISIMA